MSPSPINCHSSLLIHLVWDKIARILVHLTIFHPPFLFFHFFFFFIFTDSSLMGSLFTSTSIGVKLYIYISMYVITQKMLMLQNSSLFLEHIVHTLWENLYNLESKMVFLKGKHVTVIKMSDVQRAESTIFSTWTEKSYKNLNTTFFLKNN